MPDVPPTAPGPLSPPPPLRPSRARWVLLGLGIHAGCVLVVCFAVPLAQQSNIWPIAGVVLSVYTVPVGAATGALTGWAVSKQRAGVAVAVLVVTGCLVAAAVGVVIALNK